MKEICLVAIRRDEEIYREQNNGYIIKIEKDSSVTCEKIDENYVDIWRDLTLKEIVNVLDMEVQVPSFKNMKDVYGTDDYFKKYPNLTTKEVTAILQKEREIEMKKYVGKDIAVYLNNFYIL